MRIELAAAMRRIPVRQEGIGVSNQANLTSQRDCDTWRQKVQQLARVRNPNFLNVLDVIFDKSSDFVITERPRGHSLNATHMLSAIFERSITMKNLLILLICFAFICTVRATDISDLIIEGLPVKVLSSGKSYKVFEQYPWEGHSSNYGPKGNRLDSSYGVGVGKNISRSLQLRHGDWIHMPDIGWRQINEFSSKNDSIEFFATYRDEYKSKHSRLTIDMVAFALPSQK